MTHFEEGDRVMLVRASKDNELPERLYGAVYWEEWPTRGTSGSGIRIDSIRYSMPFTFWEKRGWTVTKIQLPTKPGAYRGDKSGDLYIFDRYSCWFVMGEDRVLKESEAPGEPVTEAWRYGK